MTDQAMTWDHLKAKLDGSAFASGLGSAQSNVDLVTGVDNNNMTISGLVSGLNSDKGQVNALVIGNGTVNGTNRDVFGIMNGTVAGTGNSTIVGASSIDSNPNQTSEIQSFANSNAFSSGNSSVSLISNTNIENDNGIGIVYTGGKGQGTNNYIVASNGLKNINSNEDAAFIGSGYVKGVGSDQSSNASQSVDTVVDDSGNVMSVVNLKKPDLFSFSEFNPKATGGQYPMMEPILHCRSVQTDYSESGSTLVSV
uniref:Uncharacterized protein n=1 Tax=Caenorhabditis japonica TaxID=281687 RepID=A0A8R1I1E0_CAEJA